jgi:hypothetical protein
MAVRHDHVTFTATSNHFYLHSTPVKTRRRTGTQALQAALETKKTTLSQGNKKLLGALKILAENDESILRYVERYEQIEKIYLEDPRELRALTKFNFFRIAFREILGVTLYRF